MQIGYLQGHIMGFFFLYILERSSASITEDLLGVFLSWLINYNYKNTILIMMVLIWNEEWTGQVLKKQKKSIGCTQMAF